MWAATKPSTVSRRLSIVVGFYRVCVIDQILPNSPADYVRRPTVPAESPTLGLGHLQFEALITTARLSTNPNDFALVALLGLLGLRIFEARGSNITDLAEEHGHRVLRLGQPVGDELGVGDVDVGEADVQPGSFLVRARRAMIIWENDARPGRG